MTAQGNAWTKTTFHYVIARSQQIPHALPAILEEYLRANPLCAKQQYRYRLHVKRLCNWHRHYGESVQGEPESAKLNAWLQSLEGSPVTINAHRQSIITLLRFAADDGDPLPRSDRIRREKTPEKINFAFTREELGQMLQAAKTYEPMTRKVWGYGGCREKLVPRFRSDGIAWGDWWFAFIRAAYESGQYLADLAEVTWDMVSPDGTVTFSRKKTGRVNSFRLSAETISACRKLGNKKYLMPWPYDIQSYFAREFRKFTEYAQVRPLGAKSIRRSAATYTMIDQGPEAARSLMGHASFATTAKHYIDWSIARKPVVCPPAL